MSKLLQFFTRLSGPLILAELAELAVDPPKNDSLRMSIRESVDRLRRFAKCRGVSVYRVPPRIVAYGAIQSNHRRRTKEGNSNTMQNRYFEIGINI
jgi:hypothetical protein